MYKRSRKIQVKGSNDNNISSDCSEITFVNLGDTPCTISVRDSTGGIKLYETDSISFGDDSEPCVLESDVYEITFDTLVTTRSLLIMRTYVSK